MRLRRMPERPEPILDLDAMESVLDLLERYDELRRTVTRFWVVDEAAGRVSRVDCGAGRPVVKHTPI
ncbi:hypothetical protein [Aureimonas sp. AU40]|uniref:hypothetical protein n=1 Tax=Aureimonas sp. AU40 TaxID=1637747 RepID=UPI000782C293|nr:hypothetical protein [Aureimonas sp. AU40]